MANDKKNPLSGVFHDPEPPKDAEAAKKSVEPAKTADIGKPAAAPAKAEEVKKPAAPDAGPPKYFVNWVLTFSNRAGIITFVANAAAQYLGV